MKRPVKNVLLMVFFLIGFPGFAEAQDAATAQLPVQGKKEAVPVAEEDINPGAIPTILFTYWEHTAIVDAKRSRGSVRAPTEEELMRDLKTGDEEKIKPPPEEREITLGGIAYASQKDWTIWLNGKRVTPDAMPREVMDLKVYNEYIEMKWFDDYSNQIFPIRLRPHQRFNIDTRIFLPG